MVTDEIEEAKLKILRTRADEIIPEILCLAHLVGKRALPADATVRDSEAFWHALQEVDCFFCPYKEDCTLCVINE